MREIKAPLNVATSAASPRARQQPNMLAALSARGPIRAVLRVFGSSGSALRPAELSFFRSTNERSATVRANSTSAASTSGFPPLVGSGALWVIKQSQSKFYPQNLAHCLIEFFLLTSPDFNNSGRYRENKLLSWSISVPAERAFCAAVLSLKAVDRRYA